MTKADKKLLIVEDDPGLQRQLRWAFEDYEILVAEDRETAIAHIRAEEPSIVTLDLGLPPAPDGASEGMATLEEILGLTPEVKVIVVTGNEDRGNALKAVSLGAYDFCQKPVSAEVLGLIVDRAHHLYEIEEENRRLIRSEQTTPLSGLITADPGMLAVCRLVERVAPAEVAVLLLGESGTGKELLARGLHDLSSRKRGKFVAINCAAIPESLIESELFGHEKGAFTGAVKQTKGRIELADHGTLFLDEIGDVPLALQVKLLRFLQERVIERVGGRQEIAVDVRIVCATHRDLDAMIAEGSFREDLFYRLSELAIRIPPLRDREGDSIMLAHGFLLKYAEEMGRSLRGFSTEAIDAIAQNEWHGNVRELDNRIKRAVIMADGNRITVQDLDLADPEAGSIPLNLKRAREDAERREIPRALIRADGNISTAAKLLGVSRPTLYDLMRHHHIKA